MHHTLTVFVYGTLKRGGRNHALYCREHGGMVPGAVQGRLIDLPEGCPMLFVPPADVIEHGSHDPAADIALGHELVASHALRTLEWRPPRPPWALVTGEVYTMDRPLERLEALDRLEWFVPGGPSDYCRVILPVRTPMGMLACWAYVSPHSAAAERALLDAQRNSRSSP